MTCTLLRRSRYQSKLHRTAKFHMDMKSYSRQHRKVHYTNHASYLPCLLPCLGPLAPRGAIGARHDGLPRQFSPLLPVVCDGLSLSEGLSVHSAMLSLQLFFGLPLLRLPSTVPCSITLVRPSDLVMCPYHFSFRRFTVASIYDC